MLTITLGKRTWALIFLALTHWFTYKWAYDKGGRAGVNWVIEEMQKAQEHPAKPDGEPGYLDHSHDKIDQS